MENIRVVIVEDDELLLKNLGLLLEGEPGISVVGSFASAEEAVSGMKKLTFDILLADLGLPGESGIELIEWTKEKFPDSDIMAHTVFDDRDTVFAAIKAGASGYILKGTTPRELIEALHNLHGGGAPMSPKIARAMIQEFQNRKYNEQYLLTPREKEILLSLEKGLTYTEIADSLNISPHTVHTHIKNTYDKLHATGRMSALRKARRKGII